MRLARNIGIIMQARGLDAAKLARLADLNPTGVYDILSGKSRSPKLETVGRIARALGVSVSILIEDEPRVSLQNDLIAAYEQLPDEQRALLLQTARAWAEQKKPA